MKFFRSNSFRSIARSKSLSIRLFFSVVLWLICAVVFTGYTLLLSWELENGGIAINDAGSLRKRTYQIALLHNQALHSSSLENEKKEFERVLDSLSYVGQGKLFLPDNPVIGQQVVHLKQQWQTMVLPWYKQLAHSNQKITLENRLTLDLFAQELNTLVKMIENNNTETIQLLRLFQKLLLAMTVVTAITGIYLLFRLVIRPLDTLRGGIQRLSDGDLNSRVHIHTQDEFGLVSTGFNQMAMRLQDLYHNLEQKVAQKTHELSSLYEVTAFLHESHTLENMTRGFIEHVLNLTDAQAGSVRLLDVARRKLDYMAQIGLPESLLQSVACTSLDGCCGISNMQASIVLHPQAQLPQKSLECAHFGFADILIFPIRFHEQDLGIFTLYFKQSQPLDPIAQKLIETLCGQLGVAIENQHLIERNRQFAVSEERNLIAQGLHDSIAQSLSFLNIQVQLLEVALKQGDMVEAQENLANIKDGVQESYDDVRELLLNFRTRLLKQEFGEVVQTLMNRFEQQANVKTELSFSGDGVPLSPQEQLQVVFILQEALSNVRKHANAQHVLIKINNAADFKMTIQDDGQGFDAKAVAFKKTQHVGTAIMQERANMIHGLVHIESQLGKGTCVILDLPRKERSLI